MGSSRLGAGAPGMSYIETGSDITVDHETNVSVPH